MNPQASDSRPASVAVILVNWNSWRDTVECIDSVLVQSHRDCHIFVVDNDSADGSLEHIQRWCAAPAAEPAWRNHPGVDRYSARANPAPVKWRAADRPAQPLPPSPADCRLTLIRSGGNLGFAGGCNVGIRAASPDRFDYFWFLNNDTVIERSALEAMLRRALQDPKVGMVGSTLLFYDTPGIVQALAGARMDLTRGFSRHIGEGLALEQLRPDAAAIEREMTYICGASMLVSAAFVREIGLMQEDYFLYFEEIDWAMRGQGKFTLGYAPDSQVFHKSGASSSKKVPVFAARHFYRNYIRFMSRFFPHALPATKRSLAIQFLRLALKGHWAQARIVATVLRNSRALAAQALATAGSAPRL